LKDLDHWVLVPKHHWSNLANSRTEIASLTRVQGLAPIASELKLTSAQLAVAWVLQNENVASAIIGASRPEQVKENVVASGVKIPAELMTQIDEVLGNAVVSDPALTLESSPKTREA